MIKATAQLRFPPNLNLDLTKEMEDGADLIAQEIRGNIKRGSDTSEGVSLRLNSPEYAALKLKKLGHQKPLQAFHRKLVDKSGYVIKRNNRNDVTLRLSDAGHPGSKATIAQIGAWNHHGTDSAPARPFFLVSKIAQKRVVAMVADKLSRLIREKKT